MGFFAFGAPVQREGEGRQATAGRGASLAERAKECRAVRLVLPIGWHFTGAPLVRGATRGIR
jgi:hypothetical protein